MPAIPETGARQGGNVVIERLGSKGDGQVRIDGEWVSVSRALPGEEVRIAPESAERARLVEVVKPSPDRVTPPCPHFGTCGGCNLQHLAPGPYAAFKRELVVHALKSRGLSYNFV